MELLESKRIISNIDCTGLKSVKVPESRRIYMGLGSDAASGIDICADTNQYIDFTTMIKTYKWSVIYNATNNNFLNAC